MIKKMIVLWGLILCSLTACQRASIQILEQASASKPQWVENTQDFWESNGFLYYKAIAESPKDIDTARLLAVNRGRLALAEQMRTQIKSQFILTLQHTPYSVSQETQDVLEEQVAGLVITGTHIADSYMQTIHIHNRPNTPAVYRYYVLLQVSQQNYRQSINDIFVGTIRKQPSDRVAMEHIYQEFQKNLK